MLAYALALVTLDVFIKSAIVLMVVDVSELALFRGGDPRQRMRRAFGLCMLLGAGFSVAQRASLGVPDFGSLLSFFLPFAAAWGVRIWLLTRKLEHAPLAKASPGAVSTGLFAGLCAFWFGGAWLFRMSLHLPHAPGQGVTMGGLAAATFALAVWVGWRTTQLLRRRAATAHATQPIALRAPRR